jgi:hypothetical protein
MEAQKLFASGKSSKSIQEITMKLQLRPCDNSDRQPLLPFASLLLVASSRRLSRRHCWLAAVIDDRIVPVDRQLSSKIVPSLPPRTVPTVHVNNGRGQVHVFLPPSSTAENTPLSQEMHLNLLLSSRSLKLSTRLLSRYLKLHLKTSSVPTSTAIDLLFHTASVNWGGRKRHWAHSDKWFCTLFYNRKAKLH